MITDFFKMIQANLPWRKGGKNNKDNVTDMNVSAYDFLKINNKNRLNLIAYNYYGTTGTFGKFFNSCEATAKAFKALGVKKGDVVTICMPNTPEAVFAFYALDMIGAISNMVHPLSSENEIKNYLNMSNSRFLLIFDTTYKVAQNVIDDTNVEKTIILSVKESMPPPLKFMYQITTRLRTKKIKYNQKVISWRNFMWGAITYKKDPNIHTTGDEAATILYSGGTTGVAKGVLLSNKCFTSIATQTNEALAIKTVGEKALSIMPIFHGFGLGTCIHTVLSLGATAIILPQFSAKSFDKLLTKYRPNIIVGVPTLYEALITNKRLDDVDLSFITCAICGGDTMIPSLKENIDKFLEEHNSKAKLRVGYGLTECLAPACLNPNDGKRVGSIGKCFKDNSFKIVEPNTDIELEYGEIGEIVLSGPTVMMGYINDEAATNETLRVHSDGKVWLHTGDLGTMDKDNFIYFKQRLKRVIISSGYNIYPVQIEEVINAYPDVLTSTVIGIPHPYKKNVAKAFIVLKENVKGSYSLKKKILNYCKKSLAKYSLPYEIEFRESLPKTKIGKVAYKELMEEEKLKKQKKKKN